ncbi:phospholipase D family protein [Paraburkholderia phytofirmans]|uniref:PLD phosphodiesterase domain-containing protein n=1 Tax=Paraburkholderia phytofirmans (strain DSM 17436 / LMG 22146 / PsJN) TaxID=398527 RepID=B2T8W2_PARPJ|nr:phospholipase D family protein [Paraburkholderia phytofirmans]ACD20775.1 hypothetical protein Bphyt_6469 [Paraburkholderia phytofirmans PsJN]
MSFSEENRISIFGALKPNAGQNVTRAIITTYSLDLVAMLGLVLSLGGDVDAEFESSPLGLVKAFDRMRGRLVVLHQLGRVVVPGKHRSILPLLDTMVKAIASDEREASWHPKIALVRYESIKDIEWRFWIGSRNLTGSTDLDAGLMLASTKDRSARAIAGIADLAQGLLSDACLSHAEIDELRSARWSAPAGVSVRKVLWRRHGQYKQFISNSMIARAERGCAVSPFIDHAGLDEALKAGAASITLLTTEMAGTGCAPHANVKFRVETPPEPEMAVSVEQQQGQADGEFIEPPSTGIHAKLLAVSKDSRTAMLLGSANLTGRGLIGPNAEAVILLDVADPALAGSLYKFVDAGLELNNAVPDPAAIEKERAKRELDDLISRFLQIPMTLRSGQDGLHLVLGEGGADVLTLACFEASAFLEVEAWASIEDGAKAVCLAPHPLVSSEQTTLVTFRARNLGKPEISRTWVQVVEMDGLDAERRDRALLARYIGANRFRDWLRSLLDGIDGSGGQRWSDSWTTNRREDPAGQLARIFTLETVLANWARDPQAFERRVGEMMAMLDSFEEVFATIPDEQERAAAFQDLEEVRPFLLAVHEAIGEPT